VLRQPPPDQRAVALRAASSAVSLSVKSTSAVLLRSTAPAQGNDDGACGEARGPQEEQTSGGGALRRGGQGRGLAAGARLDR